MKRNWSTEEIEYFRERYPHETALMIAKTLKRTVSGVYNQAFKMKLEKSEEFKNSSLSGTIRKGERRGIGSEFKKGHKPVNFGKKGVYAPGSEKGWFQKGRVAQNTRPIGTTRVTKDGYVEIKTSELPKWELLQRVNWRNANGEIPKGMCLQFIDGDKTNCDVVNLRLITRKENMLLNTIHRYPEEVKSAIKTLGKLRREINNVKQ
jgi:hypothetical protein